MMISPQSFTELSKEKSFDELIEERQELLDEIIELETLVFERDYSKPEWEIKPSPSVQYQVTLEYLAELCRFMSEKYNQDYER